MIGDCSKDNNGAFSNLLNAVYQQKSAILNYNGFADFLTDTDTLLQLLDNLIINNIISINDKSVQILSGLINNASITFSGGVLEIKQDVSALKNDAISDFGESLPSVISPLLWSSLSIKYGSDGSISDTYNYSNSTSIIKTIDPDGKILTTSYNGLDGSGVITKTDIENVDYSSVITIYNSDGTYETTSYSGPNGTGNVTGGSNTIVNVSDPTVSLGNLNDHSNIVIVPNINSETTGVKSISFSINVDGYELSHDYFGATSITYGQGYADVYLSSPYEREPAKLLARIEDIPTYLVNGSWQPRPGYGVSVEYGTSGTYDLYTMVPDYYILTINANVGNIVYNASDVMQLAAAGPEVINPITVTTISSFIQLDLASFKTLSSYGEIAGIVLTDSGTPNLSLTSTQVSAAASVLDLITTPYTVSETADAPGVVLTAAPGIDVLSAGSAGGNHVLNADAGTSGTDTLYGGLGADTLNGSTASTGKALLVAGTGSNILNGGLGYDTLYGGGQSVLNAGASNQQLLGGYSPTASDTLNAGAGNYEFLATVAGHDLLLGGSGAGDFIEGGTGADTLMGSTSLTGSAVLIGGTGANLLKGGVGADTLVGGGASSLLAGTGSHQILLGGYSAGAHDTLNAGSDNAVIGVAQGNNALLAGTGVASLYGGAGNDLLQGGGGAGVLVAGTGHSTLQAGSGSDFLVGNGQSLLLGGSGANGVSVLIGGFSTSSHDTLKAGTGSGETLAVVTGNNQLFADSTSLGDGDVLYSGTGNDTLYGAGYGNSAASAQTAITGFVVGQGNSTVLGGAGNDYIAVLNGTGSSSINGGGGSNIVQFTGHTAADATITTNAAGITTVTFANSSQTATLAHIAGLQFSDSNAVHALG